MISLISHSSLLLHRAAVWIYLRIIRPYLLALPLLLALVTNIFAQTDGFTVLHRFAGSYATYHPIIGPDGSFYGADDNTQVVYKLTTNGAYTVLYNFADTSLGGPSSELLLAADGNFYGIAFQNYGNSVVYRLTPDGIFPPVTSSPTLRWKAAQRIRSWSKALMAISTARLSMVAARRAARSSNSRPMVC